MTCPHNDLLLRALARQPTARTPCWLMRQAGRYLPEYRHIRAQNGTFTDLLYRPEVATELVMQPLRRYDLDAAILFSDILTIPDAMGMELGFEEGTGPVFGRPLKGPEDAEKLTAPDPEKDLAHVLRTVRTTRLALNNSVPLIGFAGSPWTIFVYMVAQEDATDRIGAANAFRRRHPEATQLVLDLLCDAVTDLLLAQWRAGAQVLMLFDSWGGALGRDFPTLSLPGMASICRRLRVADAPVILYVRGADPWLERIADTGCDCIGIDQTASLSAARRAVGDRVALQGNLPPEVLTTSAEEVTEAVRRTLEDYGPDRTGHIFNLGQGITPDADPELVAAMVDAVRRFSSGTAA